MLELDPFSMGHEIIHDNLTNRLIAKHLKLNSEINVHYSIIFKHCFS